MIPEDGVHGRLVKIVDPDTHQFIPEASDRLAKATISVLQDEKLRARMGAAARRHAQTEFSESVFADRLLNVFRNALAKRATYH